MYPFWYRPIWDTLFKDMQMNVPMTVRHTSKLACYSCTVLSCANLWHEHSCLLYIDFQFTNYLNNKYKQFILLQK